MANENIDNGFERLFKLVLADGIASRDNAIKAMNTILHIASKGQLNIKMLVERFIEPQQNQIDLCLLTLLVGHFMYVDKAVSCQIAKPFLPLQADEELEINSQTPITAHIELCHDCLKDIETIRRLKLDQKQLFRIYELFSSKNSKHLENVLKLHEKIYAIMDRPNSSIITCYKLDDF